MISSPIWRGHFFGGAARPFGTGPKLERNIPGWLLAVGLAVLCLWLIPSLILAEEPVLKPIVLHAAFTRSSFRNVNARDATVAFRIFAQTVGRKRGYQLDVDVRLFDSLEACEAEINRGGINLAILDTWDYLNMKIQSVMEPVLVPLEQGTSFRNYLLLTRRNSGGGNLADLQNKDLMVLEGKGGDLSRAWLDSLLQAQHLGSKETFFHSLKPVFKPTAAILPVFFGSKSACLVDRGAYQIMAELNPQIISNLVIVAVSDPYLENITCLSKTGWATDDIREDVINAMIELHLEPDGRQILELFKLEQLVPFKEQYLESAQKLKDASGPLGKQILATLPEQQPGANPGGK